MQENEEEGQQKNIGLKIKYILRVFLCTLIVFCLAIIVYNPEEQIKKNILSGDYDRAIYISSIGAKIYPKNSHWYSLRGYARFNNQDYSGALEDFDTAYRLENDVYKMMNFDNKIYIKYFLKDYKSAIQDFDVEIEKCTTNDEKDSFLWDKAQFLYNIGEYQKALNIYNLLLERSKDDNIYLLKNRLHYERAEVYKKLGKNDLATEDIKASKILELEEVFETPIPEPTLLLDEN